MKKLKVKAKPPFYVGTRTAWGYYSLWGSTGHNFVGQISGKNNAEMVVNALNKYHKNEDN